MFVLADDESRKHLPMYYVFGVEDQPATLDEFVAVAENASAVHKTAYRQAVQLARGYVAADTVPHHPPIL